METLQFSVDIDAPVHTVWSSMLDDAPYREWTGEFHPGSHYTGSWELGSDIRFIGPNDDGTMSGMLATVVEHRPDDFLSLEYLGQIDHDVDDLESDEARQLAGSHENYTFREHNGVTTVTVDLESTVDLADMFNDLWPKALAKLKDVAERAAAAGA